MKIGIAYGPALLYTYVIFSLTQIGRFFVVKKDFMSKFAFETLRLVFFLDYG